MRCVQGSRSLRYRCIWKRRARSSSVALWRRTVSSAGSQNRRPYNFLGFTFICGKSREGKFLILRNSRRDRVRAKLKEIKKELRWRMHDTTAEQGRWLKQVVTGFFNYHAVPTNRRTIAAFRHHVTDLWRRTLKKRSQKDPTTWQRIDRLAAEFLPAPRILHPWPDDRFLVNHPRWKPSARIGPARFCLGGAQQ